MNKKGQVFFLTLMVAMVAVILALSFSPVIQESTDDARNQTLLGNPALDCTNTSISDFDQGACITTDLYNPYFTIIILGLAGAIIGARLVTGM